MSLYAESDSDLYAVIPKGVPVGAYCNGFRIGGVAFGYHHRLHFAKSPKNHNAIPASSIRRKDGSLGFEPESAFKVFDMVWEGIESVHCKDCICIRI